MDWAKWFRININSRSAYFTKAKAEFEDDSLSDRIQFSF